MKYTGIWRFILKCWQLYTRAQPDKNARGAQPRTVAGWLLGGWIRGRSPSRGREAPENWGRSPNRGRSPRRSGGRGLGRGLGEPLPRNFFKIITWNRAIWCIADAKMEGYEQITFLRFEEHSSSKNWFYMMWALWNINLCIPNLLAIIVSSTLPGVVEFSLMFQGVQYIWLRCLETPQLANVIHCASIRKNFLHVKQIRHVFRYNRGVMIPC